MPKKSRTKKIKRNTVPRQRHQTAAVILFAVAILLMCMVCIPGEEGKNLWHLCYLFLHGAFGVAAYILPILIGYIAVIAAMEQPIGSISAKLWQSVTLLTVIDSAIYIFKTATLADNYFVSIGASYLDGQAHFWSSGAFGTLLGYPLYWLFPGVGAKIIIVLLLFVFLMLVTGTTVIALLQTA